MWKRFVFFNAELMQSADPMSPLYAIQALDITCVSGGKGQMIFGDSEGFITICSHDYSLKRFSAHQRRVNFCYQFRNSNMLLTVGDSADFRKKEEIEESKKVAKQYRETLKKDNDFRFILEELHIDQTMRADSSQTEASGSVMSLWRLDSQDEFGNPQCVRTYKLFEKMPEEVITSISVHENSEFVGFGCQSGKIFYIQGDLKARKLTTVPMDSRFSSPISGLFFINPFSATTATTAAPSPMKPSDLTASNSSVSTPAPGKSPLPLTSTVQSPLNQSTTLSPTTPSLSSSTSSLNQSTSQLSESASGSSKYALLLYAVSQSKIGLYAFPRELKKGIVFSELEETYGGEYKCSCINQKGELIVGREDAIYYYTPEGRGNCYVFGGKKQYVCSYKDCILVGSIDEEDQQIISIYNMDNRFLEFDMGLMRNGQVERIYDVLIEWNTLFVLSHSHTIYSLKEKDINTKLELLFEKNLFAEALRIATSNRMDASIIMDIHRMHGDYLYTQGDYDRAIEEYTLTIGQIEPSYVIRRFLDAQRIHNLTSYLEALHLRALCNSDHTTLLINCYTKLREREKLHDFIYDEKSGTQYDVVTAIDVLRRAGCFAEALHLAKKNQLSEMYVKIQLEDNEDFLDALNYIWSQSLTVADRSLMVYGKRLLEHLPRECTDLLIQLCTKYVPRGKVQPAPTSTNAPLLKIAPTVTSEPTCALPENFIHCFVDHAKLLKRFVKEVTSIRDECDSTVWNTLLELFLRTDLADDGPLNLSDLKSTEITDIEKRALESRVVKYTRDIMSILTNPKAKYDDDQALILVQMFQFKEGQLYLYRKLHMYPLILRHYLELGESQNVFALCTEFGSEERGLWIQLLTYFAESENINIPQLQEILTYIEKNQIMPTLLVLQILSRNTQIDLGLLKDFVVRQIKYQHGVIEMDSQRANELKKQTDEMQKEINALQSGARVFQATKCVSCGLALDLPSVHFLCGHSYHKNCVSSKGTGCPKCAVKYRPLQTMPPVPTERQFYKELEGAPDGFAVVAEYFGRGMFSETRHVVTIQEEEENERKKNFVDPMDDQALDAIPIVELKL